ncbi:hypothetical protein [Streptomyces sp. NPDC002889]|uniref:hypothetical protein n=1 Tax=Streptomyces sp. NPDC002889 TaxID=3364669 RepID=UPI0036874512
MPRRVRGIRCTCRAPVAVATAAPLSPACAQGTPVRESGPVHSYEHAIRESMGAGARPDGDGEGRTGRVTADPAGTNRPETCADFGGRSDIQPARAVVDRPNPCARGRPARGGSRRAGRPGAPA